MSLVHETLYQSNNLNSIDFEDYIKRMVMGLISSYNAQRIDVKFNIENIMLNIETVIPCGLIINELVTNAIKHAFPNDEGLITIKFTHGSDKLKLIVNDNGVGLPDRLLHGNCNTVGLQLIKTLIDQLDGEFGIDNSKGTTFTVIFEELKYAKRL